MANEDVLEEIPFIGMLPATIRPLVIELLEPRSFEFGDVIIQQGGPPDGLYLMVSGSARVVMAADGGIEATLGHVGPGDTFGEAALLDAAPRSATIRASSHVEVLTLDARVFDALRRLHPELGTALEGYRRVHTLQRFLRTQSAFASIPLEGLMEMGQELTEVDFAPGERVIEEGDPADCLYIVKDGRLKVSRADGDRTIAVGYLRTGDAFGEAALRPGQLRQASVEASIPTKLLRLDAEPFRRLAGRYDAFEGRLTELIALRQRRSADFVPLDFAADSTEGVTRPTGPTAGKTTTPGVTDPDLQSAPAFAEQPPPPAVAARPSRRFPVVRQLDAMDCGAACLGMIAQYHGHRVSMPFIRQEAGTSTSGTTLAGLRHGGAAIGLAIEAVKVSPERLGELQLPAIVHWEGNHWVVLISVDGPTVRVADPAIGPRKMSRAEFDEGWTRYAAIATPTPDLALAPRARSGLQWLVPFLRPHRKILLLALVLAFVAAAAEVAIPLISQLIVDHGILKHDSSIVTVLGLIGIALGISSALIVYAQRRALTRVAVGLDTASLEDLTDTLFGLPLSYFEARRTGDLERRLTSLQQINQTVTRQGVATITSATQLVMIIALMLFYSPVLVAIFVAMMALFAVSIRYAIQRVGPVYASLEHAFGQFTAHQVDTLKGIETVKAAGERTTLLESVSKALTDLGVKRHTADRVGGRFSAGVSVIGLTTVSLFTYLGAVWVLHDQFTLGQYLAFLMLAGLAVAPSQQLALVWDDIERSSVLLQRLQDVFEQEAEQADRLGQLAPVQSLAGEVELKNMAFSYRARGGVSGGGQRVLSGINLHAYPGMTVGLVGRSGSGKSTLLRLLAGLLEPTEGTVLYDSVDITGLDYGQLRQRLGFVLQNPYLFSATIAENIAFGASEIDRDRVRQSAEIAAAHDFIDRLPLRYDTPVGDSGLRLSGGQAQRVAIARAVYWDPAVLLLDEPTSALDAEAERTVKDNLNRVLEGRTAFVVAHRLSTIRDADLIVVLDQGHIVETGTHEDLMAKEGLYAYLYAQQVADL